MVGKLASRAALPLAWTMAVLWLLLQATGRGAARFLQAYERGWSAAERATVRVARAAFEALGSLGRALRTLFGPMLDVLRRIWAILGVYVLRVVFRPLGRLGRWLLARLRPIADRLDRWKRRLIARVAPVLASLVVRMEDGMAAVERLAASLRVQLRPVLAPISRWAQAVIDLASSWSRRRD